MHATPRGARTYARALLVALILAGVIAGAEFSAPPVSDARGTPRLDPQERILVRLINGQRRLFGLPALRVSRALNRAASRHSWEVLAYNWFAHSSPDGTPVGARVRAYRRARSVGENIVYLPWAWRQNAGWEAFRLWLQSPGHRAVMLSPSFRRIGVGQRGGSFGARAGMVITADFTSRR